jgi:transposase
MRHLDGDSREQGNLLPDTLDDYVAEDHPVRVIDAFVDNLNLVELGFSKSTTKATGRKPYNPADLLKLYVYGYLNQVRSSRRLEKECHRNLEVLWLMKRLAPDFKTIADFRKDNTAAIKGACRAFIQFCREANLLTGRLIAIDGSRFKAAGSADKALTRKRLRERRKQIDRLVGRYLQQLDQSDMHDATVDMERENVQQALKKLEAERVQLAEVESAMDEAGIQQYCTTEPEARLMRSGREGTILGYNIQSAVDTDTGLIVHHEVTQDGNDQNQLQPIAEGSKAALAADKLEVVADAGYANGEHLANCEAQNITATVPNHRGINNKGEYYPKEAFRYDPDRNSYWCPAGQELPHKTYNTKDKLHLYTTEACSGCALKSRCTGSRRRWVSRHFYEEAYARSKARLAAQPELMRQRRVVERPFGILKHVMGLRRFQCRGKSGVEAETGLGVLGYNLSRMINEIGVSRMLLALK